MNVAIATTEFVSDSNFDGGLANYTYKLAKWLKEKGNNVTVFVLARKNERLIFEGINVIKVNIPDLAWHYKFKFERWKLGFLMSKKKYYKLEFESNAKYINKAIEAENKLRKFDIIQYPHNSGLALYRLTSVPCVVRVSSSTKLCQKYGGYGYDDTATLIQDEIEKNAMKKADVIFGPSKMISGMLEKEIQRKIQIIETPFMSPPEKLDESIYIQKLENKKYCLFFGSIGLIKGVGTIAEIIFDLLDKNPDLFFVFVGKKLKNQINGIDVWDNLINKAKQYKNRIIQIEPLKHSQLFPIIKNSCCVVLPSRIDNFPNTCIEAMANEKIVIGTIGNGFDQLIEHGKNGFVIPIDDHKVLLSTIIKVLNLEPFEKLKIQQAAKERIDLLNPDIVLNQVLDLYKETIDNFK